MADPKQNWRANLAREYALRTETEKNGLHYPPEQTNTREKIFRWIKHSYPTGADSLAPKGSVRSLPGSLGGSTDDSGSESDVFDVGSTSLPASPALTALSGSYNSWDTHYALAERQPLRTLVLDTRVQREHLKHFDDNNLISSRSDCDNLFSDMLYRLLYSNGDSLDATNSAAEAQGFAMREMAWRYNFLNFLWRCLERQDSTVVSLRRADDRGCCGAIPPRVLVIFYNILHPMNWWTNCPKECPYQKWEEFVADYNAWGRGKGPRPRWLPAIPPPCKKIAELAMALFLLTDNKALGQWLIKEELNRGLFPLRMPEMTEQFLFRRNMLQNTESAAGMLSKFCVHGKSVTHNNAISVVDLIGENYGPFIGGVAEQIMNRFDMDDAIDWIPSADAEPDQDDM